jgi:hypothetical protein
VDVMFDGTQPHEERVHGPARSQRDMVQASLNHEMRSDPYMARLGERRQGWRGRLAHVELLLTEAQAHAVADQAFTAERKIAQALHSVRAMIDGE